MKTLLTILLVFLLGVNFSQTSTFELNSSQFSVGDKYISNPIIRFDLAKWNIQQESHPHLDSIAEFLIANDSLIIELGTHTDSRGSDKYSMRLDVKRSESIVDYLIGKGVNSQSLIAKGYGESQLLISEKDINNMKTALEKEQAHAKNRRTEFKIVAINTK